VTPLDSKRSCLTVVNDARDRFVALHFQVDKDCAEICAYDD
jgi:hypothetical protein